MQRYEARRSGHSGFTLMEMLLVLAILVVLMGLVAPRILGTQKKADRSATQAQIGMLKAALERYALDVKQFPSTEQGLGALVDEPTGVDQEVQTRWDGPYVDASSVPKDPWGREIQYEYPPVHGDRDFPDIWSLGPDGEDNTEDDVVNWTREEKFAAK